METTKQHQTEKINRRIDLSGLFYPLERNESRRWGTVLKNGFDAWSGKLSGLAREKGYDILFLNNKGVLWKDPETDHYECLFLMIGDPSVLKDIEYIFKCIRSYEPFFTYAFIHQVKDGPHCWDVFRYSQFSYMEHCNRIYSQKQ
jgi:hypothetical protein